MDHRREKGRRYAGLILHIGHACQRFPASESSPLSGSYSPHHASGLALAGNRLSRYICNGYPGRVYASEYTTPDDTHKPGTTWLAALFLHILSDHTRNYLHSYL